MIMTYLCALFLAVIATSTAFSVENTSMTRNRSSRQPARSRTELFSLEESIDTSGETLLRINFSVVQGAGIFESYANNALEAVRSYTQSFPFAAVLPVQPLTYLPVKMSDGSPALKVTFLRKKTAEKGSQDGGIVFTSRLVSEEDCDPNGLENYVLRIELQAKRITEGQTIPKIFSEKQICLAFIKGLSEKKGQELLAEGGGVVVDSVFHIWMDA
mmetsp:Transcript_28931/g.45546  ORF Transcript_28931/g.45546 Transcript_28931/m.45546 type:complete len:215 (-) Transcript_28931:1294-1938(-)